uniref:Uncharacterized protein n=1 Tax=Pithovirus LCPAC304 TaxID=2506594 RepID=A0A481Z9V2_9VIRU|nr:MAG: hypothetical protein LCPAC304_02610 [Pithovirus LCPAC304]
MSAMTEPCEESNDDDDDDNDNNNCSGSAVTVSVMVVHSFSLFITPKTFRGFCKKKR